MQGPHSPAGADSDNAQPSSDRKRKLHQARDATKQQTISDVLSTSQQKPTTVSPRSKRVKPNPPDGEASSHHPATATSTRPLPPEKMYTFTSKRNNGEVIDLTGTPSPAPSPARRPNGARKPNFNPHTGAKQLVVKNLKKPSTKDPWEYFNTIWTKIDAALDTVFKGDEINFSLETLYKGVENICRQNQAADLANKLHEKCRTYVETGLKDPLIAKASASNVDVLKAALSAWKTWRAHQKPLLWIFCFLDRSYLLPRNQTLDAQSIVFFRTLICEDPTLQPKIVMGVCDLVAADRSGDDFDKDIFKDAVSMFHSLTIYTSTLEPKLLELSQQYIISWGEQSSASKSLAEYVRSVMELIEREMERCELFNFEATTSRDLLGLLEEHLIQKQQERLVNRDEIADLMDENAVHDLEQTYKLLDRRGLGTKLRPAFEKWIEDTGTAIVFDEKEQESMIIKLLTLKKQLDTVWRVSFHRDTELGHGLREAFELFINKSKKTTATWNTDNSKPGEMIAKYVDTLLRGGAKAIPTQLSLIAAKQADPEVDENELAFDEDTEMNNQLDQVLDLFRFVHGKAVFEAFYKKDFARRLLMGRSASADAERSMLARLKTECGAGFTQNLEQMFKDIDLSREELGSYKSLLEERGDKVGVDLSVNILSASAWPTYPDIPVVIPTEIQGALDKFTDHYKSKHSGRKLDWKHALAHCQIRARFPKGNKELIVSSFQAVVMLLFNNVKPGEHLSYELLKAETGLPPPELKRTLQSLACAKLRPLTKHPKGRDINETDTFTFNEKFTHEKYRLKVNQVQLKETKEENKETHERVAADRNFETQAAIVRIMKSRKRIGHAQLVAEVIEATKKRGVLSVQDIKKNIDRLVDKDYMEREENNEYSYIA
ncbi:uncharacterized protein K452DRAFT_276562 [Aplosporella prunicola CBS 121167]|uniref:Cullin family profile domain-containing protein n=1 Tax=Aplosporella prunicola CBS 121167 TaxID=1176127 RepID=A0A6A6B6A2_9PEZI|nr:uncharacterized protein K452DRAFT_276562 [Aplosporella prunicola CBS 121167]KAF2138784.1 hypothetical protein K452DRAFT_276562 [Aplosporella prunicola CBS 121167]